MLKSFVVDTVAARIMKGRFLPASSNLYMYKCNSDNYRTIEFDTVDWGNSVVLFGCSNVFGIGLSEEDTLSSQLSKLIDMPVINMGISATSMEFSFYNSMILSNSHPTPKAVIQIWTGLERTTYYLKNVTVNHGTWNMKEKYMDAYNQDDSHPETHAIMMQLISKQLWSKTKYFEASFFSRTSKVLGIHKPSLVDAAKDNVHPGAKTCYNLAAKIKDDLCL